MRKNQAMAHQIAVLVLDGVVPFDLGTPAQVFGSARTGPERERLYELLFCGEGPVRTEAGFTVTPDHDLSVTERADTVLVPGIHTGGPVTDGSLPEAVREALLSASRRGARIVSICTGASVLAAAGLLDGRPAATHWAWARRIGGLYPRVNWDFDVLFVDDGDVLTSAGVGAGVDLCLHIVRSDHGAEVANGAARRCVVPPWRDGGQAQYIERPVPPAAGTGTEPTRSWVLDRLSEPVSLEEMAGHARMSVRTFTRRFRDETGSSPRQWLLRQRVEHARLLLESTDLGVDVVARRAGLGSATALRQHLQATIGVAPSAYRRTFRHAG
ncbi:GlxA family transcriptional regulator [Actinoplanes regularis]|uniref:Transcriptional regulator GlxA family, contains an amidase domain and an AraC-type DNA-binding HTH domain n=1 Tax=Actinoplanes regularis TaxID=52697 RepID=A0A239BLQ0_9ACTN|nr:helix-turn-helix domain-containing protein [Actinoplanes regularis]GIE88079.1 transcriptional regulator [Actinoplanes regularis]SNS08331.1 Transcriptional regulator GlxA family, contains an amidase domain and an AraC-type DNA-binding HTH domain [Actinoplanes regularis]